MSHREALRNVCLGKAQCLRQQATIQQETVNHPSSNEIAAVAPGKRFARFNDTGAWGWVTHPRNCDARNAGSNANWNTGAIVMVPSQLLIGPFNME